MPSSHFPFFIFMVQFMTVFNGKLKSCKQLIDWNFFRNHQTFRFSECCATLHSIILVWLKTTKKVCFPEVKKRSFKGMNRKMSNTKKIVSGLVPMAQSFFAVCAPHQQQGQQPPLVLLFYLPQLQQDEQMVIVYIYVYFTVNPWKSG